MRNLNQHRWLPLIAVASILASAPVFFAQAATSGTPATAPAADRIINVTYESPTPEEIGDSLMTYQRYQEAIASYKRAAGSAAVMNKMGIAYQLMFNFQDALRCYDASLKLDPASAHVYNNLGTVYDGLLDYRSAERMYRKALKQEPGSALVVKNLGSNLLAQHKYKQGWSITKPHWLWTRRSSKKRPTDSASSTRPRLKTAAQ
jgi:Flp pilus assembly protein TadD